MDTADVISFLRTLKLPQSVLIAFMDNEITGQVLVGLSDDDLQHELAIKALGNPLPTIFSI